MTGAYLRAKRGDKWENIEVEHLTPEELREKFLQRSPEELVNWMDMLCGKIREIEPLLDDWQVVVEHARSTAANKGGGNHERRE